MFVSVGDHLKQHKNKGMNVLHYQITFIKNIATPLKNALVQCGFIINQIGNTYQADHVLHDGSVPKSALDHVYHSETINDRIKIRFLF